MATNDHQFAMSSNSQQPWWSRDSIRAVTLYPWATMDVDAVIADLADKSVSTVMVVCKESDGRVFYDSDVAPSQVPERDILAEIVEATDQRDMHAVPVFLTLCDKFLLERNPGYVQIARDGTEIRYPNVSFEWMHWVCPSYPAVRDHLHSLAEEISEYNVDGIRFQNIEFQPIRNGESNYRSCFCDACLAERAEDDPEAVDEDPWQTHRIETNAKLLATLAEPFDDDQMVDLQLEVFADMESTLQDSSHQLGLDIEALAAHVDTLSPRTAHIDMDVHPLWIRDVTRSLVNAFKKPILPSIRTASRVDSSDQLSEDELHTAIQMALHGGAHGVSLFSAGANIGRLTEDQWQVVMKTFDRMKMIEN